MKQIFPGIFREGNKLYTINLVPGKKVYGEKLIKKDNEYREWDPMRSKLAAAILNGLRETAIKEKSRILYLGASTGTTCSHVSDIIGHDGVIYAVEFSERVFHPLISLAKERKNVVPILADARKPEDYSFAEYCDIVFVDIADPQETAIAIRNADEFLEHGYVMIAIKSQSIDVTKKPEQIYKEEAKKLKDAEFTVLQLINLEPYEEKHAFILAKK
jgi:fibrillarin-like pre-rRNA processing protein